MIDRFYNLLENPKNVRNTQATSNQHNFRIHYHTYLHQFRQKSLIPILSLDNLPPMIVTMRFVSHLFVFLIGFVHYPTTLSLSQGPITTRIKVCQNKDCQKRFHKFSQTETLVQTFSDIIPPSASSNVAIESTGCLSQCGNGPNVSISGSVSGGEQTEKIFGGVDGALMASAVLEVGGGIGSPDLLLIAAEAIAKSTRGTFPLCVVCILSCCLNLSLSFSENKTASPH